MNHKITYQSTITASKNTLRLAPESGIHQNLLILSLSSGVTSAIMWDNKLNFWIMRDIDASHAPFALVMDLGWSVGCGMRSGLVVRQFAVRYQRANAAFAGLYVAASLFHSLYLAALYGDTSPHGG